MEMVAPCLKTGGVIGICSPSHVAEYEEYQVTLNAIRQKGFRVMEADNLYKDTYGYLAAPQERADDFNRLVENPEVELIWFGGGEGGNELLPYLDFELLKQHPKRICSYSDGTTILNAVWAKTKLETYYGQTPKHFREVSAYDYENFLGYLVRDDMKSHKPNSRWQVQNAGTGEGILIGGYARNFAMLLGSRYFPVDMEEKYLLFLEDYEAFGGIDYVSAMISHIEQTDFIHCVKGLVFGHYSEQEQPYLLNRLKRLGEQYGIPVVYCDDFGHGYGNHAILPIGRMARLDTELGTLCYL